MVTNGLVHSLCRRANVQNVSFETLNGSQLTLSTQLVIVTPFIHLKFLKTDISLNIPTKWYNGLFNAFHYKSIEHYSPYRSLYENKS